MLLYKVIGGFQLLDLIIVELKSHMSCYNSMPLIGWNYSIQTRVKILWRICFWNISFPPMRALKFLTGHVILSSVIIKSTNWKPPSTYSPNWSTTSITTMGCRQCLPPGVVQLNGKHCRKFHCRNVVVDMFRHIILEF